jgi:hypothetical protein
MKRLLVFCALPFILLAVGCALAILLGRSQPPIDLVRVAGLSYCHAQVCFRGVALGTDWESAMEKLTPNVNDFRRYTILVNTTDAVYDMTPLESDLSLVGQIEVGPTISFGVDLGDIVGQYGAPCLVSYLAPPFGGVQISLIYPGFDVVTPRFDVTENNTLGFQSLDPVMPIAYADFYLGDDNCPISAQLPNHTSVVAWRGFARLQLK